MRFLQAASFFSLVTAALGCAPISFTTSDNGTDQGVGGGLTGFGGGKVGLSSGDTGSGGGTGGSTVLTPLNGSYSYLCGGVSAACSPDPGSEDCAPGGDPHMGTDGPDASKFACQLVSSSGSVKAKCTSAGEAGDGDPCDPSAGASCQAGFACVAGSVGGICRRYCCQDLESCPASTYCAPVAVAGGTTPVPVCIAATGCALLADATCPTGQTCSIVRSDGTTSCVTPGLGHDGDGCPCAAGFTCSKITNTCLKLCDTHSTSITQCGPGGSCAGGSAPFPENVGTCAPH